MNLKIVKGLLLTFLIHSSVFAQKDTLINKLDSLSKKTDSGGGQVNNITPKAYNENTKITVNTYKSYMSGRISKSSLTRTRRI